MTAIARLFRVRGRAPAPRFILSAEDSARLRSVMAEIAAQRGADVGAYSAFKPERRGRSLRHPLLWLGVLIAVVVIASFIGWRGAG